MAQKSCKIKLGQLNNQIKFKLKRRWDEIFKAYVTTFFTYDNWIWNPTKNSKKSKTPAPSICTEVPHAGPLAKSDNEKADLFAEHFVICTLWWWSDQSVSILYYLKNLLKLLH